jgi:heme O synthase-like polyprenyltransferase
MIELLDMIPVVTFLASVWAFNRACNRHEDQWMGRTRTRDLRHKE